MYAGNVSKWTYSRRAIHRPLAERDSQGRLLSGLREIEGKIDGAVERN
jgi:hypothetical protein